MKKKYLYLIILLLYGLLHTTINIFWVQNNCLPPYFDPAHHLERSLEWHSAFNDFSPLSFLQELRNFPLVLQEVYDFYTTQTFPASKYDLPTNPFLSSLLEKFIPLWLIHSNYNPPLVYIMSSIIYGFFGTSYVASQLALTIFIFILLFSIYGIGKELYNEKIGFYAAILSMLYPGLYLFSREFFLDLPIVAMVSLSIFLLIKTNYFKNRFYSMFFGVSLALGMLTRWTFAVFIIGPLAYYLYKSGTKNYKNILISILVGFILSLPWYLLNLEFVQSFTNASLSFPTPGPTFIPPFTSLIQWIRGITVLGLTPIGFLFFISALFLLIKQKNRHLQVLYIWILVSLGIFSLTQNVQLRYLLPIYPAFALITIVGIKRFQVRVLLFTLLLLIFISWFSPYPYSKLFTDPYKISFDTSCSPNDWKIKEILMSFPPNSNIGLIDHADPLSDDYFSYIAKRENISLVIYNMRQFSPQKKIQNLQYFIYIGDESRSWLNEERVEYLYDGYRLFLNEPINFYTPLLSIEKNLIETHHLPLGVILYVYKVI